MEYLTATEIKKRKRDFFDNPSPALQELYKFIRKRQEMLFNPLIKRTIELLKKKEG